jgi:hypothetical protein
MPYTKRDKVRESRQHGKHNNLHYEEEFNSEKTKLINQIHFYFDFIYETMPASYYRTHTNKGIRTQKFITNFKKQLIKRISHEIECGKRDKIAAFGRASKRKKGIDTGRGLK